MRVESPLVQQQPLIESQKTIEKKEISESSSSNVREYLDESHSFLPSPFGTSGTYSLSSLRTAVDYHAKFLTVAENNQEAVNHPAIIPRTILGRLGVK